MKWRSAYIIYALVLLAVGYMLEPVFFSHEEEQAHVTPDHKEPIDTPDTDDSDTDTDTDTIDDDTPVVIDDTTPDDTDDTPPPPDDDEPIPPDIFVDSEDDDEEEDPEGTTIKKMKRVLGEDDGCRPVQEAKLIGNVSLNAWRNPRSLERKLATAIRTKLKGVSNEEVTAFLSDPENRLMITQWDLLHRADMNALCKLMGNAKVADSLASLLNDLQWITGFVYDGELVKPEVALAMLYDFRKADPNMDKDIVDDETKVRPGVKRRVAAAVAVEFTRNEWYGAEKPLTKDEIKHLLDTGMAPFQVFGAKAEQQRKKNRNAAKNDIYRHARERYMYYAESWDEGLLNTSFGNLPDWLLRFTCGFKSSLISPWGSVESFKWQRDNCSARTTDFTGMCGQVSYLPLNFFGADIFGTEYYAPFLINNPEEYAKAVHETGGVCGSLSHFGASAACANGIPAFTMTEPGHCAFAVYVNGKWVPSNSISEKRNPHHATWGMTAWSAMQMYSRMYEEGQRTRDGQMVCSLSNLFTAYKNPNSALKLYEMSMAMQPLYNPVWQDYLEAAAKTLAKKPARYLGVNEFVCSSVAAQHPEMCAHYLTDYIYPSLLKILRNPKQKMLAYQSYFDNLNQNEKAEWDMESLLNMQYDSLGRVASSVKESYFKMLADAVTKHPDFGMALSWAVRKAYMENRRLGDKVRGMIDKILADMPKDEEHAKPRRMLNAAVVRAAEEMCLHLLSSKSRVNPREKDYYISLATQYSKDYMEPDRGAKPLPSFFPPSGNLISPGGIVMLETYDPDQSSVVKHAAALTNEGGAIISEKGKHLKLILELPKKSAVGGMVIVPIGSLSSYRQWTIETSLDGKTWELASNLPDSLEKDHLVVDFKRSLNAKFIRIDSGGEQLQGIRFRALLVYDNRKPINK